MDQVCQLQTLVIVFRCPVTDTGIFVLQFVSVVFLGIEALVLDLPTQASVAADLHTSCVLLCHRGRRRDDSFSGSRTRREMGAIVGD